MPLFSLEAQAGSSRQHEEEQEYARLGAEWLSQSYSSRWEQQEQPSTMHQTPPPRAIEISLSLGFQTQPISAQSKPATPRCAPEEQDNEYWEQEMLKVVRKAKETQKGAGAKNKELQALTQQAIAEKLRPTPCPTRKPTANTCHGKTNGRDVRGATEIMQGE